MSVVARLEAILSANTRDFDRAMDRSSKKTESAGASMKKIAKAGFIAGGGFYTGEKAAEKFVEGIKSTIEAGVSAQKAQARLAVAFKNAGVAIDPLEKKIGKLEAANRRLGFSDTETKQSLGSLITVTHNYQKAVSEMGVAQNLARFKGVSLEQATKALTMAHAGSLRPLKQLGLDVPKVTDAQDKLRFAVKNHTTEAYKNALANARVEDRATTLANVLKTVTAATKGQADAYSNTAAGAMAQFHAQVEHIQEVVGLKLLPVMTNTIVFIRNHWPEISAVIRRTWETDIKPPLDAMISLIRALVDVVRNNWGTIGPIVKTFGTIIESTLKTATAIIKTFTALLRGDWSGAWQNAKAAVDAAIEGIKARIQLALQAGSAILNLMASLGTAMLHGLENGITDGLKDLKQAITGLFGKVIGWAEDALGIKSPSTVFHGIGQNVVKGFINGVGSMGGALKKAVVHIAETAISHLNPFAGGHSIPPSKGSEGALGTGGPAEARKFAISQLPRFGWGMDQFSPLNSLWNQESGWNRFAKNRSSGAYGIPQALPPTKMPFAAQEAGGSNMVAQVMWGLNYIKGRYGSPAAAWNFDVTHGMQGYGTGGVAGKRGVEVATLGENGPEVVAPLTGLKGGTWQQRYYDFMQRVWQFARPYFPNAMGSMPPVKFTSGLNSLFVGTDFTPDAKGNIPPPGKRTLYWPKWLSFFADRNKAVSAYETLIHEWAHEFQDVKATQGIRLGEGGAEAFAEAYTPAIYRGLGFNIKPSEIKGIMGNYYGYVKWVLAHKGMGWVNKGQFGVFDKGGVVPGTGPQLAVVHGGETILPTHKQPISHHIARIADAVVDWKQSLTRFVLETNRGNIGIPTERMQRSFFNQWVGRGISRAQMLAVIPWWEKEGFFEQLASRKRKFDRGGWLMPGSTLAVNNTGRPERVISGNGDNIVIPISLGGEHVATVMFDMLRRKAKVFENRNGRPAFGGA